MRLALALLTGLLFGACKASAPAALVLSPPSHPSHVDDASALESRTVALVMQMINGTSRAYCSGVWVSERTILTARHCVDDQPLGSEVLYLVHDDVFAPQSPAVADEMRPRMAHLSAIDEAHDLALLYVTQAPKGHAIALLHDGEVHQGSFAQAMGHSLGLWYSYSTGVVSAVRELDFGDGMLLVWVQSTTPVSPGNSGGGLFDEDDRLIGVCHAILQHGQGLNLFVHVSYVRALMSAQATL